MTRAICMLAIGCAVAMGTETAFAAHPLVTDDTGTQGAGKIQLEAAGAWLSEREHADGQEIRETGSVAAFVIAAGISESLDLMVGVPYVRMETKEAGQVTKDEGVADTIIEAKWRFHEKERFSVAIKPGIILPTGSEEHGRGTGRIGYAAFLLSTFETGQRAYDVNLGYLYRENRLSERVNLWFASLAARYAASAQWTIAGEIGAARNTAAEDSSHPAFTQAGVIYSPADDLDLSLGFLAGIRDAEIDQSIRIGVTIRF